MYAYNPTAEDVRQREAERGRLRRIREDRIRTLKREVMIAKRKLREHDHLLAELRSLERDRAQEMEEELRRRNPPRAAPTPLR